MKWHPDRNQVPQLHQRLCTSPTSSSHRCVVCWQDNKKKAEEKFKKVSEAYEILSDTEKRQQCTIAPLSQHLTLAAALTFIFS